MMKTWINRAARCTVVLVAWGAASAAYAQKLGFVDLARIFQESKQAVVVQEMLNREFGERQIKLEQMRESGLAFKQRLENGKFSVAEREKQLQQMLAMDQDYRLQAAQLLEEYNLRRNEEFVSFQQSVYRAIQDLARRRGYSGIITEAVYFDPKYDITDEVIRILNAQ
ncbi:outer membrane protein [Neisseria sp. HSC-16F19]|nr:OmpH family outer membrane protein [Neisseria sp. HSC-16F19]MCP2039995.1 outer membrane protein [Neisseria sp. HSC-16F19]